MAKRNEELAHENTRQYFPLSIYMYTYKNGGALICEGFFRQMTPQYVSLMEFQVASHLDIGAIKIDFKCILIRTNSLYEKPHKMVLKIYSEQHSRVHHFLPK